MPNLSATLSGQYMVKDPNTGFLENTGNWKINGFNAEKKLIFIEALKQNPSTGFGCKQSGISPATFANHYHSDPQFKKEVDHVLYESKEINKGDIEMNMLTQAKRPSGFMWAMAWLKRHYPGEYSERKYVEHSIATNTLDRIRGPNET